MKVGFPVCVGVNPIAHSFIVGYDHLFKQIGGHELGPLRSSIIGSNTEQSSSQPQFTEEGRMKSTKNRSLTPAFVAGVAVGAGIAFAQASRAKKRPEGTITQRSIDHALDRTLHTARKRNSLRLDSDHRYVIFSDHHKGADNDADDFKPCKNTYLAALDHYYAKGYALIVMGDAEELWEEQPASVMQVYRDVFESEARFHQDSDRYIRIHGNHDDAWQSLRLIDEYLSPYFPPLHDYGEEDQGGKVDSSAQELEQSPCRRTEICPSTDPNSPTPTSWSS